MRTAADFISQFGRSETLANQSDQHDAARALEAIGEIAEPAVIPLLTRADQQVRYNACALLGKIGGAKSVATIKKLLLREQEHHVKFGAEIAMKALGKKGL
ncbi:MAG TPA: HEAT repeat domain-containing protein [Pirellulales bacterium]|nr:HEAT repeat domain-containing protein [Pirellulales bacterium]